MTAESRNENGQPPAQTQFGSRLAVLRCIHLSLVGGVALFGGVVFHLTRGSMTFTPEFGEPMSLAAVAACVITLLLSSVMRPRSGSAGASQPSVQSALQKYQVFFLMRAALIEGGALFSAAVTLVSRNILPAALFVISALALASRRPSESEFDSLFPTGRV